MLRRQIRVTVGQLTGQSKRLTQTDGKEPYYSEETGFEFQLQATGAMSSQASCLTSEAPCHHLSNESDHSDFTGLL